jgi:phenylalanyl-tRNA synthetase beta chain
MRQNLLFGGLEVIAYNVNRKQQDLKLFEFGKTYQVVDGKFKYAEEKHLSLFLTGRLFPENHLKLDAKVDFAYLKASVDNILKKLNISFNSSDCNEDVFAYAMQYQFKQKPLVKFGLVNKTLCKKSDINNEVYYADFNWDNILSLTKKVKLEYSEIPKFPSVRRDLALLIDKKITYKELEQLAFSSERKLLKEVNLFDVYEGDKLEAGKKSYALSFILQDDSATLNDKQIDNVMQKLIKTFNEKAGASLR